MNALATPLTILAWLHVIAGIIGMIALPFVVPALLPGNGRMPR